MEDWEWPSRITTTEEMERSIRRAPTKQGREEEWNPTLRCIFRKRAASPTTCQDEVTKEVKFQGPPPPPPASPILSSTPSSSFPPPSRPMLRGPYRLRYIRIITIGASGIYASR